MNDTPRRTWLVTGCSTGLGRALCEELLEAGEQVVATARRQQDIADLAGPHCLTATLDVTHPDQVEATVKMALGRFGRIDVLVNNAGYGAMGVIEEFDDARARHQFDVNVFGVLNMQRAVLPVMRSQGGGHVLNLSSIAGLASFPMAGMYCASKHALEALSEALAAEVEGFGIRVTLVEPGRFRTEFSGRSLGMPAIVGAVYAEATAGYDQRRQELDGQQPGCPRKAAQAMRAVVDADDPPLRLLLGTDAYAMAQEKLGRLQADFEAWKHVTLSTDIDE